MTEKSGSSFSGFYKRTVSERVELLTNVIGLSESEVLLLKNGLETAKADLMIENVIGKYEIPLAVAINFIVDGKEILVPMVTEEASIVAGASKAAKMFSLYGGFLTEVGPSLMKGQIQIIPKELDLDDMEVIIKDSQDFLINFGNSLVPNLVRRGGGVMGIEMTKIPVTSVGPMASVDILVDTGEAMGANLVNQICEGLSDQVSRLTKSRVNIRICSNYSEQRITKSKCWIPISGENMSEDIANNIVEAQVFAENSIDRAVTHNKGILNGIDAVALATGQDWRAIEAGAHSYAARFGYRPLTNWLIDDGVLRGEIELPVVVGIFGGITSFHPQVAVSLKVLGVKSSKELSSVMASAGLAQNFAAMYSLVNQGITHGHGSLHWRKKI